MASSDIKVTLYWYQTTLTLIIELHKLIFAQARAVPRAQYSLDPRSPLRSLWAQDLQTRQGHARTPRTQSGSSIGKIAGHYRRAARIHAALGISRIRSDRRIFAQSFRRRREGSYPKEVCVGGRCSKEFGDRGVVEIQILYALCRGKSDAADGYGVDP